MVRRFVAIAVAVSALAFPGSALAWSWGFNYVGPSTSVGGCPWYTTGSVCSSASWWSYNFYEQNSGGTTLGGFENYSAIRGHYESGYTTDYIYVSATGLSPPVFGTATYWSGNTAYLRFTLT